MLADKTEQHLPEVGVQRGFFVRFDPALPPPAPGPAFFERVERIWNRGHSSTIQGFAQRRRRRLQTTAVSSMRLFVVCLAAGEHFQCRCIPRSRTSRPAPDYPNTHRRCKLSLSSSHFSSTGGCKVNNSDHAPLAAFPRDKFTSSAASRPAGITRTRVGVNCHCLHRISPQLAAASCFALIPFAAFGGCIFPQRDKFASAYYGRDCRDKAPSV